MGKQEIRNVIRALPEPDKKIVFAEGVVYDKSFRDKGTYCLDWYNTQKAIDNRDPLIRTSCMGLMSFDLCRFGYKIYLVDKFHHIPTPIVIGNNEGLDKDLRFTHNIFNMWRAGVFNDLKEAESFENDTFICG